MVSGRMSFKFLCFANLGMFVSCMGFAFYIFMILCTYILVLAKKVMFNCNSYLCIANEW